jgi:selenocysteine lyase/cysteine desulfurase
VPPVNVGWWSVKAEGTFLDYELDFFLGSRRYEAGSLPTAQIEGLGAAIDLLDEMGIETIRERILDTVNALAEGLSSRGWTIATPRPFESGILAAVPPDGNANRAAKELEGRGVIVAPREGAVRFSPHAYNDREEVNRLLEAAEILG